MFWTSDRTIVALLIWPASTWVMLFGLSGEVAGQSFTRVTDVGEIVTDAFLSTGASWTDINNDGWLDLYALSESANRFYLNNGDGTFSAISGEHFVTSQGVGNIGIWGDHDNDGSVDLFLGNFATQPGGNTVAPNFLYRNAGPPLYTLTLVDLNDTLNASPSASWIDYDQDGDLDLFSAGAALSSGGTRTPDLFFRNDGNSTFVQLSDLPFQQLRSGIGTHDVWIDYDNDGDQDLFVVNWARPNEFYKNLLVETGNPNLFQTISDNGLLDDGGFFDIGSNWGDYDNDGDFDVFVVFTGNTNDRLYQNNGDGTFDRMTDKPFLENATSTSFGVWGDYDNDGDLDLFAARVAQNPIQPALYRNEGNGQFVSVNRSETGDILLDLPAPQAGSWGDYDNDGDLDLYVLTYANPNQATGVPQPNYLIRNDMGNANHWLMVKCVGQLSNRSAIGAKIRAKALINDQEIWQVRYVSGGASSFVFQADLRVHLGLADATAVDSLKIEWPSGIVQVLENVPADQVLTVSEEIPSGFLRPSFYATQTTSPDTSTFSFQFVDASQTDPSAPISTWGWDFDSDGEIDSNEPNPNWTYNISKRAFLPVSLTVSNGVQSANLIRRDYIEVGPLPNTTADTERIVMTGIPSNLSRVDTTFYVHNRGRGADSVFVFISDFGGVDTEAISVSPQSSEVAADDSLAISFAIFPSLLTARTYVTRVRIRSKFNPAVREFEKIIIFAIDNATGVRSSGEGQPVSFDLLQNHPNPFNGSTLIRFDLPSVADVVLKIYNVRGQEVKTLLNSRESAGRKSVRWDGRDADGLPVGTGVYLYQIQSDRFSKSRKLVFLQ
jgi:PKD repeat protein